MSLQHKRSVEIRFNIYYVRLRLKRSVETRLKQSKRISKVDEMKMKTYKARMDP